MIECQGGSLQNEREEDEILKDGFEEVLKGFQGLNKDFPGRERSEG